MGETGVNGFYLTRDTTHFCVCFYCCSFCKNNKEKYCFCISVTIRTHRENNVFRMQDFCTTNYKEKEHVNVFVCIVKTERLHNLLIISRI